MQAAAKAARGEMMQRIRDNKATQGDRGGKPQGDRAVQGPKPAHGQRHGKNAGGQNAGHHAGNPPRQQSERRDRDELPRHVDPLQTNLHNRRHEPRKPSHGAQGQPDPMRTSIDSMADRGRGGRGGRGGPNRSGGGGGGFGSRGPGNPGRSFGGR
jgi:ATP-dependent RNA helicase RhlE